MLMRASCWASCYGRGHTVTAKRQSPALGPTGVPGVRPVGSPRGRPTSSPISSLSSVSHGGAASGSVPAEPHVGWGFVGLYMLAYTGTSLLFLAPLLVSL